MCFCLGFYLIQHLVQSGLIESCNVRWTQAAMLPSMSHSFFCVAIGYSYTQETIVLVGALVAAWLCYGASYKLSMLLLLLVHCITQNYLFYSVIRTYRFCNTLQNWATVGVHFCQEIVTMIAFNGPPVTRAT